MEIPQIIKQYEDYLKSTIRPSNRIIFTVEDTKPWESKLGGCPYLEDLKQYPMGESGKPMMFMAQINLGEMPPLPDFPREGLLQFYVENDDCFGLDSLCVVKYIPQYITDEAALVRENPYYKDYEENLPFIKNCRITFEQEESMLERTARNLRKGSTMYPRRRWTLCMTFVRQATAVWVGILILSSTHLPTITARIMCCCFSWMWTKPAG